MPTVVPKKFYRNVFRGVSYYTRGQKRSCKLSELVAYVYLKNGRALPAHRIEDIVKNALVDLCSSGVIRKTRDRYQLSDARDVAIAGPSTSGASNKTGRRSTSASRKAPTATKRTKRNRRAPVDADGPEADEGSSADENEEEAEPNPQPFLHWPLKMEQQDSDESDVNDGDRSATTITGNSGDQQAPKSSWFSWLNIW